MDIQRHRSSPKFPQGNFGLADARHRILLVSYATYTLPEIAADLQAAVVRGCAVDVVFETVDDNDAYRGPSQPFADIPGLMRWRWPHEQRPPGAALHAKLLVVDGRRALVGSANLTHRALNANTEAGIVTCDEQLASALERHVRDLMVAGVFTPLTT